MVSNNGTTLNLTGLDVIVIGGGPAGATAATLLADAGRRVLLLERGQFPRHHIGESLMPHTYWTFKRLGMLDQLRISDFPTKECVQFVSESGKESQPYFFTDRDPHESSQTWQVRRDEFDRMMVDNARSHGAEVRMGTRVTKVLFEGDRAVGVEALIDGQPATLRAKVVVDATGQSGLIARQLGLRYPDERLKNAAIYSYYEGCVQEEGRAFGGTIIVHTPGRNGWFWFIPISKTVTSVGVVAPPSYLCTGRGDDPAATLDEEIAQCPGIARRLANAQRVDKVYVTSDFSYRSKRIAGDGWVLVGDAFGFLDPVYSSGVMLALKSGELAADTIDAALREGDTSGARLGTFGPDLLAGLHRVRQLVYAWYDRDFSVARFLKMHPEYTDHLVRTLMGDVFDPEIDRMFNAMRAYTDLPDPLTLEEGVAVA